MVSCTDPSVRLDEATFLVKVCKAVGLIENLPQREIKVVVGDMPHAEFIREATLRVCRQISAQQGAHRRRRVKERDTERYRESLTFVNHDIIREKYSPAVLPLGSISAPTQLLESAAVQTVRFLGEV